MFKVVGKIFDASASNTSRKIDDLAKRILEYLDYLIPIVFNVLGFSLINGIVFEGEFYVDVILH